MNRTEEIKKDVEKQVKLFPELKQYENLLTSMIRAWYSKGKLDTVQELSHIL